MKTWGSVRTLIRAEVATVATYAVCLLGGCSVGLSIAMSLVFGVITMACNASLEPDDPRF